MSVDAFIVLLALAGIIGMLALTRIAPDAIVIGVLTFLLAVPVPTEAGWKLGVLGVREALLGFANPGVATVAVLFVVVAGLRETGAIDAVSQRLLGRPSGTRGAIVRVCAPVWAMSAFLNNTPVVAVMIPALQDWARKLGIAPSKLMIPLSYAAILGGTCTLIGTSTNLVVAGLVVDQTDLRPLRMFDISWVGVPAAVVGGAFLVLAGPRLLPDRRSPKTILSDPREYTLELLVPEGSAIAGRTIEQVGFRNLPGCFLVEVSRGDEVLEAVGPEHVLRAGDRLLFAGVVDAIRELARARGLVPATDQIFKLDSPRYRRRLFEAVVSATCPIAGMSIREGRFRNRYNGAVIAVARSGERVRGKIGDIELRPGDVLLIEAPPGFADRHRDSSDFLLVSAIEDSAPRQHTRAPIAAAILVGMVALAAFEVYSMLVAAMVAAGAMIVTRCCTVREARRSVKWPTLIVIAGALGIGRAMDSSGAARLIADSVLSLAGEHPWLALLAVCAVTSLLTEIITNNAAVALVFPIAYAASQRLGVDFMPFVIGIMMSGSASFATPLGYQTNLMVYGPGGYTLADFLRIGVPMNVLMLAVTVTLSPLMFPF
ncbi:MAG: SLC13 family permease [Phycisphaeraceae bacterium]|nr:SLC13 family permease [Phycisphaeraceae bacterium]